VIVGKRTDAIAKTAIYSVHAYTINTIWCVKNIINTISDYHKKFWWWSEIVLTHPQDAIWFCCAFWNQLWYHLFTLILRREYFFLDILKHNVNLGFSV
jgi:hypothetical protein